MGEDLTLGKILEEISKREERRLRQQKTAEESAKEGERQKILKGFEDELARLLRERDEFKNFRIPDKSVNRKYIRKVAKELGFGIKMIYDYEERQHFFVFTVPESQAEQRTFVQERLEKFEDDLKQAKFFRKSRIKEECRRVLDEIKKNQYKDICLGERNKLIYIESEEEELDEDDKSVIFEFFYEYKLHFQTFSNGCFYFHL